MVTCQTSPTRLRKPTVVEYNVVASITDAQTVGLKTPFPNVVHLIQVYRRFFVVRTMSPWLRW